MNGSLCGDLMRRFIDLFWLHSVKFDLCVWDRILWYTQLRFRFQLLLLLGSPPSPFMNFAASASSSICNKIMISSTLELADESGGLFHVGPLVSSKETWILLFGILLPSEHDVRSLSLHIVNLNSHLFLSLLCAPFGESCFKNKRDSDNVRRSFLRCKGSSCVYLGRKIN